MAKLNHLYIVDVQALLGRSESTLEGPLGFHRLVLDGHSSAYTSVGSSESWSEPTKIIPSSNWGEFITNSLDAIRQFDERLERGSAPIEPFVFEITDD
jgi:hypothetical protein